MTNNTSRLSCYNVGAKTTLIFKKLNFKIKHLKTGIVIQYTYLTLAR